MSNCQSLNKNLENSFHIELMDSLLYFYECKIHVGKSVENTGHIFMYYVPVVNKAMKRSEQVAGLQFIYFLACTLF